MLADGLEHVEFMTAFATFKFIGRHFTAPPQIVGISEYYVGPGVAISAAHGRIALHVSGNHVGIASAQRS